MSRVFFPPILVQLYILRFFRAVIDQQTWTDLGSVSERRLRSEVLSLACHLNDPVCVQRAHQTFNDWLLSNYTLNLPTDVAETVYSVGARDDRGWASLFHLYNISLSEAQKKRIMFALTCSTDPNKLKSLLELSLEGKVIRTQDLSSVILMVQLFFESIKDQANQLSATQLALDNLEKNIRWCERNLETLRAWLDEQRN
ncbi:hypothetical protein fugu_003677 [Takifugu bimaculatus]|uniref:ERAP1-like C-terminal domain-containing protein n=1 Tax=Takifugu bimaculatus TaxID=433685 RepID=A0A4Z2BAQ7_9TELE|nr:hypothetical protein fugu_003677 [Takifugu bimaculatus]